MLDDYPRVHSKIIKKDMVKVAIFLLLLHKSQNTQTHHEHPFATRNYILDNFTYNPCNMYFNSHSIQN